MCVLWALELVLGLQDTQRGPVLVPPSAVELELGALCLLEAPSLLPRLVLSDSSSFVSYILWAKVHRVDGPLRCSWILFNV